jgi:g-D-glutamyl-meso-diaminopimelate peptidase
VDIALRGSGSAGRLAPLVAEKGGDTPGLWQANARGVDLNHNFDAGRAALVELERESGICGPAPRRFGGETAESEPETKALTALCRRGDFRHVIALHSQGEEIYWQYGPRTPPTARMMADVLAAASGYRVADPEGLASHGGFKDWFIEETGRPGFTIELGRGVNPLPLTDFEPVYAKAREMLLLAALM